MERYSVIHTKLPREFLLLQGTGCKWNRCSFCDYHTDISKNPFEVNKPILEKVTGEYRILDIINSGSAFEFDNQTLELIKNTIIEKGIHTLWVEMHYMYRNRLNEFRDLFAPTEVKFRCGVETFNPEMRNFWNKGIPNHVKPENIAEYFQGICLLCCVDGQTKEQILNDIEIAKQHFEYFSLNLFCNNTTAIRRDDKLAEWFMSEVYPSIINNPKIEILIENTDLGVG